MCTLLTFLFFLLPQLLSLYIVCEIAIAEEGLVGVGVVEIAIIVTGVGE